MSDEPIESRRMPTWLAALAVFGTAAVAIFAISFLYPDGLETSTGTAATATTQPAAVEVVAPSFDSGDEPIADAAEVILPSTVHIQAGGGVGSGVIYREDGYIITAAHVVDAASEVRVRFADGEQVRGTVVGLAEGVDIAVIKVDMNGLAAATFSGTKPRVGQMAIAVGSPWGLEATVTAGIISAVDQTNCAFDACYSMVQTDAAINPGNSGGALVDRQGHVVGINVSIFSTSGSNDGVGFAVPANIAVEYADGIISGEPIETAFLGVRGANVETAGQAGSVVTEVVPGSGAETADLRVNDVVVGFGGVPIFSWQDLIAQVRAHQPGETVEMLILRDGESLTLDVTLGVREEDVG